MDIYLGSTNTYEITFSQIGWTRWLDSEMQTENIDEIIDRGWYLQKPIVNAMNSICAKLVANANKLHPDCAKFSHLTQDDIDACNCQKSEDALSIQYLYINLRDLVTKKEINLSRL